MSTENNIERAGNFTWDQTAVGMLAVYERLAKRGTQRHQAVPSS